MFVLFYQGFQNMYCEYHEKCVSPTQSLALSYCTWNSPAMTAVHPFSCPRAESVEIFSQQILCNTICFLFQIYRLHVRGVVILYKNYSGERYFSPLNISAYRYMEALLLSIVI